MKIIGRNRKRDKHLFRPWYTRAVSDINCPSSNLRHNVNGLLAISIEQVSFIAFGLLDHGRFFFLGVMWIRSANLMEVFELEIKN